MPVPPGQPRWCSLRAAFYALGSLEPCRKRGGNGGQRCLSYGDGVNENEPCACPTLGASRGWPRSCPSVAGGAPLASCCGSARLRSSPGTQEQQHPLVPLPGELNQAGTGQGLMTGTHKGWGPGLFQPTLGSLGRVGHTAGAGSLWGMEDGCSGCV